MRKFIALALVALMMLALVPTVAFAAAGDVKVIDNTYTYYTGVNKPQSKNTAGGIAYVSTKFGNFVEWQIPGNALTGNALSWGKWIAVTATIEVEGAAAGTIFYIDGAQYTTDANGRFPITFYTLPVAEGNQVTRTLVLYTAANKIQGYATVALIYQDVYTPKGSAFTIGLNQANAYASMADGVVTVDVVFSNLLPSYAGGNSATTAYSTINYYPVGIQMDVLDKDGNKFPAFTRVDVAKTSAPNFVVFSGGVGEVPNAQGTFYLTEDSTVKVEKRWNPAGTAANTLDVYKAAAIKYAGYAANGIDANLKLGNTAIPIVGWPANMYAGMNNSLFAGQTFNAFQFNSWKSTDLRSDLTKQEPFNETLIKSAIDATIIEYFEDRNNQEAYGTSLKYPVGNYDGSSKTALVKSVLTLMKSLVPATDITSAGPYAALIGATPVATDQDSFIDDFFLAITGNAPVHGWIAAATGTDINTAFMATGKNSAWLNYPVSAASGYEPDYLAQAMKNLGFVAANAPAVDAAMTWNILAYTQFTAAVKAYRADVDAALGNTLQSNANLFANTIDTFSLTFTTPTGAVSTMDYSIKYNSVSRIAAKTLTTLSAPAVTVKVGETVDVSVSASQSNYAVTALPIKFKAIPDENVASIAASSAQTVNSNKVSITGKAVGTMMVRAYLDSANDPAECYIYVTVVAADDPVIADTTTYVCNVRKLWVRDGAGTSYAKLGYLSRGDKVEGIDTVDGWVKFTYEGKTAFSSMGAGKYLKVVD